MVKMLEKFSACCAETGLVLGLISLGVLLEVFGYGKFIEVEADPRWLVDGIEGCALDCFGFFLLSLAALLTLVFVTDKDAESED